MGTPSSTKVATSSSCRASSLCPPAEAPWEFSSLPGGSSSGFFSAAGSSVFCTAPRSAIDFAARACQSPSAVSGRPSRLSDRPSAVFGTLSPATGREAPATVAPASIGGISVSSETASNGSVVVASSHRPTHPVVAAVAGEAVCQIAMERKWLRSGFG